MTDQIRSKSQARPRGIFITFEGGEGTGKSTQSKLLAAQLSALGLDVLVTREPGGSPLAEKIRELLLGPDATRNSPITDTLLFNAARSDHVSRVIGPALQAGRHVICDRFADSTRIYQGIGGTVATPFLELLESIVLGDVRPDITFVLDLPVDVSMERARRRLLVRGEVPDPFESLGRDFHEQLRNGFLQLCSEEPQRCALISASASPIEIHELVWSELKSRCGIAG